jgi:MFS family permease
MHIAFIAATAALGGLLFGYDTGVISGALLFLRTAFHLSPLMLGVVTSTALGGAALGAAFAGHGHTDEARAALLQLRGHDADINAEMVQLRDDLTAKAQAKPENHLGHKLARLPMIVGVGLAVFQQVTGINTVIYYAPTIFQASGLPSASAAILATAGIGVVKVVMTMLAIWLVDRVGRRALLLCGLGGMGISLCLLALAFMLGSGPVLGYLTAASLTT